MKYCTKCGQQVEDNTSYCPNCGYHFIDSNSSDDNYGFFSSTSDQPDNLGKNESPVSEILSTILAYGVIFLILIFLFKLII